MAIVLGTLLILFRIPYQYDQPPLEANVIADLSDRIVFVEERADEGRTLEILLDHPSSYMASILVDLGRSAVVISRGLQQHFPNLEVQKVRFVMQRKARGVERLMLEDRMIAIELHWTVLMHQQFTESYPFQTLLNLSSALVLGVPEDEVIVRSFCADKVSAGAAEFCARYTR